MKKHRILTVKPDSIGEELDIKSGDLVLEVNGQPLEDIFDYDFLCQTDYLELLVESADGGQTLYEIEKDEDEDLGLTFENGLMDEYRSCRNKCIFCFIDQMPPGMRETLYFKDDDARLSFLQGNYITLTNLSDQDVDRIIRYRLSPINISVHTMNPVLRCEMLHNRFAGEALKRLDQLFDARITMNGQIVLCPGINDGGELHRTIDALARYLPVMESVSVVPVGLTKYRDGLYPLRPFLKEEAESVIDEIEAWQKKLYPVHGLHFVHASDEFYLLAERALPEEERYDGYLQLENGVGMLRLFTEQFYEELLRHDGDQTLRRHVTVACGRLPEPTLRSLLDQAKLSYPGVNAEIIAIENHFFGEQITVSGLVTGGDLIAQLKDRDLGSCVLIPATMLRAGERVFLDDVTVSEAEDALGVPILVTDCDGASFLRCVLGEEMLHYEIPLFRAYEAGGKNE